MLSYPQILLMTWHVSNLPTSWVMIPPGHHVSWCGLVYTACHYQPPHPQRARGRRPTWGTYWWNPWGYQPWRQLFSDTETIVAATTPGCNKPYGGVARKLWWALTPLCPRPPLVAGLTPTNTSAYPCTLPGKSCLRNFLVPDHSTWIAYLLPTPGWGRSILIPLGEVSLCCPPLQEKFQQPRALPRQAFKSCIIGVERSE